MQRKRKRKESTLSDIIRYTRKKPRYTNLSKHLEQLDGLIGMQELQKSIVAQIQFIITTGGKLDGHFLNTVLQGPPGTGKTLMARAIASECSREGRKVAFFMRKGADCLR